MNDIEHDLYTVLMAVYEKDIPEQLDEALRSLLDQTIKASEVLIVIDGPLNKGLDDILNQYESSLPIRYIKLPKNKGLANALKIGVLECRNELIGRMDSDDICVNKRFELQLNAINNSGADIVGGLIEEFNSVDDSKSIRKVPEKHEDIVKVAKYKSPFNHVSVLFKKSKVIESGNYKDFRGVEDYPLWVDMLLHDSKSYNLQNILVRVRAGDELAERRGGVAYAKMEFKVMLYFYKIGFYNLYEFLFFSSSRFLARVLGRRLRIVIYSLFRD